MIVYTTPVADSIEAIHMKTKYTNCQLHFYPEPKHDSRAILLPDILAVPVLLALADPCIIVLADVITMVCYFCESYSVLSNSFVT